MATLGFFFAWRYRSPLDALVVGVTLATVVTLGTLNGSAGAYTHSILEFDLALDCPLRKGS